MLVYFCDLQTEIYTRHTRCNQIKDDLKEKNDTSNESQGQ